MPFLSPVPESGTKASRPKLSLSPVPQPQSLQPTLSFEDNHIRVAVSFMGMSRRTLGSWCRELLLRHFFTRYMLPS